MCGDIVRRLTRRIDSKNRRLPWFNISICWDRDRSRRSFQKSPLCSLRFKPVTKRLRCRQLPSAADCDPSSIASDDCLVLPPLTNNCQQEDENKASLLLSRTRRLSFRDLSPFCSILTVTVRRRDVSPACCQDVDDDPGDARVRYHGCSGLFHSSIQCMRRIAGVDTSVAG